MSRTLDEWNLQLRQLGDTGDAGLVGIVKKELTKIGATAARNAKKNATTAPKVRTGALRNSIRSRVVVNGSVVEMQLGASMVYARIQEYGGLIGTRHVQHSVLSAVHYGTSLANGYGEIPAHRYLGKAMDTATEDAKKSVSAAIKNALSGRA